VRGSQQMTRTGDFQGTLAYAGKPEELREQLAKDIAKWKAVIEKAGIPRQ